LTDTRRADTDAAYGRRIGESRAQARHHCLLTEGSQLDRHAGQHDDDAPLVLDPETRRGSARVEEHLTPAWHHRLAQVILGHPDAALTVALLENAHPVVVLLQRAVEHRGDDFAREIVVRRAEATGRYDHVGAC